MNREQIDRIDNVKFTVLNTLPCVFMHKHAVCMHNHRIKWDPVTVGPNYAFSCIRTCARIGEVLSRNLIHNSDRKVNLLISG